MSYEMYTAPRLTDQALMATFPEAKEIIPLKLAEFEEQRIAILTVIGPKLAEIKTLPSTMHRWFWRKWLRLSEGEDLLACLKNIDRLQRQLRIAQGYKAPAASVSDEAIRAARSVLVEDIINQQWRRSSNNLVGLCPLHDDKTPSFHVYLRENRGWCFGCNQGGDAIGIYMLLHGCGFKEAVLALAGY